jgi:hypothetical protein
MIGVCIFLYATIFQVLDGCVERASHCDKKMFFILIFINSLELGVKCIIFILAIYFRNCLIILEKRIVTEASISLLATTTGDEISTASAMENGSSKLSEKLGPNFISEYLKSKRKDQGIIKEGNHIQKELPSVGISKSETKERKKELNIDTEGSQVSQK